MLSLVQTLPEYNGFDANIRERLCAYIDAGDYAVKLLGDPAAVGLALIEAYYSGNPWLSPQQAAARAKVSDDTARRRLNELVQAGRAVSSSWEGPGKVYCIKPEIAEKIAARLPRQSPVASGTRLYG
jgi:hypothetical protein